jgi:phosphatidate cytidylyltransferase
MLKSRILTAAVLMPLAIWLVLAGSTLWLAEAFAVILLVGAWEWYRLATYQALSGRIAYVALVGLGLAGVYFYPTHWLLALAAVFWLIAFLLVVWWQRGHELQIPAWLKLLSGLLIVFSAFSALLQLHRYHEGATWLLFLLVLIWGADSGAYFGGRRWGQRKLASQVSPGKTWAGAYSAVATGIVLSIGFAIWHNMYGLQLVLWTSLCAIIVAVSILGDLVESLLKRQAQLKDSGHLLPGHGGILDRIDSLLAALPAFTLVVLTWEPTL